MKTLSLFSGIGAHDLGLEQAGMKIVGQVEIDPYCLTILQKRFPTVPKWTDIRRFSGNECVYPDIITGGFPCQDISIAGQKAGIKGKNSGLWAEMFRIINTVKPNWVLIENVPALRTRGADRVLSQLGNINYTCEPLVVGAIHARAPHRRQRVWIVGYSQVIASRGFALLQRNEEELTQFANAGLSGFRWPARPAQTPHPWEEARFIKPGMGLSANGSPVKLALEALGNANPPQIPYALGRAIVYINSLIE
jgi:DNA (cytosine-5)-methyltransferase 1